MIFYFLKNTVLIMKIQYYRAKTKTKTKKYMINIQGYKNNYGKYFLIVFLNFSKY
jgi:hypothetical protein